MTETVFGLFPPQAARVVTVKRGGKFLARLVTHDIAKMRAGVVVRTAMLNPMGGVIGTLWAYREGPERCALVLWGETADVCEAWIRQVSAAFEAEVVSSDGSAVLFIGGLPATCRPLAPECGTGARNREGLLMLNLGWYALAVGGDAEAGSFASGEDCAGVSACPPEVFNFRRVMACEPLPGIDFDESTDPFEAGLAGALDFSDPERIFIGRAVCEAKARKGGCPSLCRISFSENFDPGPFIPAGYEEGDTGIRVIARGLACPVSAVASPGRGGPVFGLAVLPAGIAPDEKLETVFPEGSAVNGVTASLYGRCG